MGALTLAVTGAAGFLGAEVARIARARGHRVRRLGRSPAPGIDIAADLATGLPQGALVGVDAVIHCAAALTGTDAAMLRDTVLGTRNVMTAARRAGARVVLAGSLSVYAAAAGPGPLDEDAPLEDALALRDGYTRAKRAQEDVARDAGVPLRIMRIGALWGPGRLWNAHLGPVAGPVLFLMRRAPLPVAHVTNAALAMVIAAEGRWDGVEAINVLDDDLPLPRRWLAALSHGPRVVVPVPLPLMMLAARLVAPLGPRVPGLLRRPVLMSRMAPRTHATRRLKALGWQPAVGFDAGMAAAGGRS